MKFSPGHFKQKFKKLLRENKQILNEQPVAQCNDPGAENYQDYNQIFNNQECIWDQEVHIMVSWTPMETVYVQGAWIPNSNSSLYEGLENQYSWVDVNQALYEAIGSPSPGTFFTSLQPGDSWGNCYEYRGTCQVDDTSENCYGGAPPVIANNPGNGYNWAVAASSWINQISNQIQDEIMYAVDSIEQCFEFQEVLGCTDSTATNYNINANTDDGSCIDTILGCTDPEASNYNSEANIDDGSCEYAGCTVSWAVNYDLSVTIDDGSCEYDCSCTCGDLNGDGVMDEIDQQMQSDLIAGTISLEDVPCPQNIITDDNGINVDIVPFQFLLNNYSNYDMVNQGFCYNQDVAMSNANPELFDIIANSGCQDVYLDDTYGDVDDEDTDEDEDEQEFQCPAPEDFESFITSQEVQDSIPFAINIPSAELFCGRCNNTESPGWQTWMINFGPDIYGFTPPLGYDSLPIVEPYCTCCPEVEDIEGCTDEQASNYNSEATIDDNSCEYTQCDELIQYQEIQIPEGYPGTNVAEAICQSWFQNQIPAFLVDYNLDNITDYGFCCDFIDFVFVNPYETSPIPKKTPNMYDKQQKLNENIVKRLQKLAGL